MKTVLFQQVTKPTLTQTQQPQGKIGYTKFGLRILLAGFSFGLLLFVCRIRSGYRLVCYDLCCSQKVFVSLIHNTLVPKGVNALVPVTLISVYLFKKINLPIFLRHKIIRVYRRPAVRVIKRVYIVDFYFYRTTIFITNSKIQFFFSEKP